MKDVSPTTAYFAAIPLLTEVARKCGYALAVHGSVGRDLDLIAAPWTEEADSAENLILAMLAAFGWNRAHLLPGCVDAEGNVSRPAGNVPTKRPHGRLAWCIHFENGLYLDVSVMPRRHLAEVR
jgi:hypothetical protein